MTHGIFEIQARMVQDDGYQGRAEKIGYVYVKGRRRSSRKHLLLTSGWARLVTIPSYEYDESTLAHTRTRDGHRSNGGHWYYI